MTFSSNINSFVANTRKALDDVGRRVAMELAARVIDLTPVATGHARANWQAGIGTPPTGTVQARDPDGQATFDAMQQHIKRASPTNGDVIHLVNNVPYAHELEFGSSGRSPNAIISTAAREFPEIVRDAIA